MTTVPSQNHYLNKVFCYGGCGGDSLRYDQLNGSAESGLRSELLGASMAEDGLRKNADLNHGKSNFREAGDEEKDEEWLKLTVGSSARRGSTMVELDLLPGGGSKLGLEQNQANPSLLSHHRLLHETKSQIWPVSNSNSIASSLSFMLPPFISHQQEINWAFRAVPSSSSSSSSSSFTQTSSCFACPPLMHARAPGFDFRIIDPPPRPHSGIFFTLQASENQAREPFLPRLSKSYLRIKDGRMTVRLVMKYLANKLGLENESEVEVRCRGQNLMPFFTLQHVRDNIWGPRNGVVLLPKDCAMVLHYCRAPLPNQ